MQKAIVVIHALLGLAASCVVCYETQIAMSGPTVMEEWQVTVSDDWNALGPFPIHAREQHFLSPSFPVNLSEPIDFQASWPSAYADNGAVSWSKARSSNGLLEVSFPDVRWASIRATEGWAALQHHTLLRTTITVYPPSNRLFQSRGPPNLLVNVVQGSFFAILPSTDHPGPQAGTFTPIWHAGNIYAMKASPPNVVQLPIPPFIDRPTTYQLFLSGDYEIRLFGDPTRWGTEVPKLSITFSVDIQAPQHILKRSDDHDIMPTFVDGWAFGEAVGVGIQSVNGWWTVVEAKLRDDFSTRGVAISLLRETRIAPSQTRIVPIILSQFEAFDGPVLPVEITASNSEQTIKLAVNLPVRQIPRWNAENFTGILTTYFFATSMPTAFVAVPPKEANRREETLPPLLFLHGAGVPVLDLAFWQCAPPRQLRSWLVVPTGRTEWGLDWHGPSTTEAWQSLTALSTILRNNARWRDWNFPPDTRVVLLGHSNGGQGAWHVASKYPDRVVAAVPVAAYVKSQAYVPLLHSRSAHFVDPFMKSVLESALTADDNDLFLSNLVDTPILAIHGGDDENVPVWHSRALVDTLRSWSPSANVTFREDPGQPHCYQAAFEDGGTQAFIDKSLLNSGLTRPQSQSFTLTVAIPSESGSLHGWRVLVLETPGRLARLTVTSTEGAVKVLPHNVRVFSIHTRTISFASALVIGDQALAFPEYYGDSPYIEVSRSTDGTWKITLGDNAHIQPSGRMYAILQSPAPLQLVIRSKGDGAPLQAALRLAHSLNVYHKLDTNVLEAHEAQALLYSDSLDGNIVVLGNASNTFLEQILASSQTPFSLNGDKLSFNGRILDQESSAVFLHPHPASTVAVMMVIYANDEVALERALRLFPVRTGLTVPDWLILTGEVDTRGAAGVQATGVWGDQWSLNGGMSSF